MAASYIRAAEGELSCPICVELFVDPYTPKILPACGHVCCVVCLKKIAVGMCDKKCPECRKIFKIPKGGVTSFLTNFRLRTLADNHRKIVDEQSLGGEEVCTCPVHDGERMHYYCTTCNVLACQACLTLKHTGNGHNIDGVKEKYSQQKVEMRSSIVELGRDIHQAQDMMETFRTQVNREQQSWANLEKEIDASVEIYINSVQEKSQKLKSQVQHDKERRMADLLQRMTVGEEEIQSALSNHRDATDTLENKPNYEYVTQHASLVDKMKRLGLEGCMSQIRTTPYAVARFVPGQDIPLGHVVTITQQLESIQTLDGFVFARNTACSADGLLLAVCDYDENKLMFYHKASNGQYEKSRILNLRSSDQYEPPRDVAICSDGRVLVARGTCIEVYTPEGNYLKNITTTAGESGVALEVCSVTTMSNGRILVGDFARSVITEHDPTGNLVRTIETKIRPFFITLIHDTHIAMSDWKSGKVSVMDMQSGQETLSIDIPEVHGICYDEQTDCLLTVRSEPDSSHPGSVLPNTGVMEMYCCTSGRLVACLATGLYYPRGIGFLSVGILAVADWKTVKLYKMH